MREVLENCSNCDCQMKTFAVPGGNGPVCLAAGSQRGRGLVRCCTWRDRPQQESMHVGSCELLFTRRASLHRDAQCVWDLRNGRLRFTLILRIYFMDFMLFIWWIRCIGE